VRGLGRTQDAVLAGREFRLVIPKQGAKDSSKKNLYISRPFYIFGRQ
jgi:hypothetical protein